MTKTKKGLLSLLLVALLAMVGCSNGSSSSTEHVEIPEKPEKLPVATITIKDFGTLKAELYPHIAPNSVYNFISLANSGFYDGLIFHRIIEDFMIQGGCPDGTGSGKLDYSIKGEFSNNDFTNDLKHETGVLSMARTSAPDSAGSQFFIVTHTSPHLDGEYAGFGKVIEGIDILDKLEGVDTSSGSDKPKEDVIIESISVDTFGVKYPEPTKIVE